MKKWTKILPYFIIEWYTKKYGEVIVLQNIKWRVMYYNNRKTEAFYIKN